MQGRREIIVECGSILSLRARALIDKRTCYSLERVTGTTSGGKLRILKVARRTPTVPKAYRGCCFRGLGVIPERVCKVRLLLKSRIGVLSTRKAISLTRQALREVSIIVTDLRVPYVGPKSGLRGARDCLGIVGGPCIGVVKRPSSKECRVSCRTLIRKTGRCKGILRLGGRSVSPSYGQRGTIRGSAIILGLYGGCRIPIIVSDSTRFSLLVKRFSLTESLLRGLSFPRRLILGQSASTVERCIGHGF